MFRLAAALVCAFCLLAARAEACVPMSEPSAEERAQSGAAASDSDGRMVVPIFVNGSGPYRFIVDTGANRSALSVPLAASLGLTPVGEGEVHSVFDVAIAPLVAVQSLRYGSIDLPTQQMPLLNGPVLDGAHGLLGADGLQGKRLMLDFAARCIEIATSAGAPRLRDWAAIRGSLRLGNLVVVEGRINRTSVHVLLDTGSDTSLANTALVRALEAHTRDRRASLEHATSGGHEVALNQAVIVRELTIGPLIANNVTAFVGDYHVFRIWGLLDEPTLLLGMDVLQQARGIAIDYGRRTIYVRIGPRTR